MRFKVVLRPDGRVGVLDTKRLMFAPFREDPHGFAATARARAERVATLLNNGESVQAYVWEKA